MDVFKSSSFLSSSILTCTSWSRQWTYLKTLGSARTSGSHVWSCLSYLARNKAIPVMQESHLFGLRWLGEVNKALCLSSHYSSSFSPNNRPLKPNTYPIFGLVLRAPCSNSSTKGFGSILFPFRVALFIWVKLYKARVETLNKLVKLSRKSSTSP